jgi:acetyl-CoA carboxylase carboxyl transferase beta subunit
MRDELRNGAGREPALFARCCNERCGSVHYVREFHAELQVCRRCSHHRRLSAAERIGQLVDDGSFCMHDELRAVDPLGFVAAGVAYRDRLSEAQRATGLQEAAVAGSASIDGRPIELIVLDFAFMAATMGSVVGEKVVRAADRARLRRVPLVSVSASGGARMHEGILALMQMARTAVALAQLAEAAVPHIAVLTDPTLGGVTASFAGSGDVTIAEQGALVGFAGPRVVEQVTKQKLPPGAQTAAFLLEHGMADLVVTRRELRPVLARLLRHYALARPQHLMVPVENRKDDEYAA